MRLRDTMLDAGEVRSSGVGKWSRVFRCRELKGKGKARPCTPSELGKVSLLEPLESSSGVSQGFIPLNISITLLIRVTAIMVPALYGLLPPLLPHSSLETRLLGIISSQFWKHSAQASGCLVPFREVMGEP